MKRREFITLIGGAAAAWSVAACAQEAERVRRIGVLTPFAADDAESMARIAAFLQGLGVLGWAVGRNVRIDYRWSAGDPDRIRKDAMELVALAPDVMERLQIMLSDAELVLVDDFRLRKRMPSRASACGNCLSGDWPPKDLRWLQSVRNHPSSVSAARHLRDANNPRIRSL